MKVVESRLATDTSRMMPPKQHSTKDNQARIRMKPPPGAYDGGDLQVAVARAAVGHRRAAVVVAEEEAQTAAWGRVAARVRVEVGWCARPKVRRNRRREQSKAAAWAARWTSYPEVHDPRGETGVAPQLEGAAGGADRRQGGGRCS